MQRLIFFKETEPEGDSTDIKFDFKFKFAEPDSFNPEKFIKSAGLLNTWAICSDFNIMESEM